MALYGAAREPAPSFVSTGARQLGAGLALFVAFGLFFEGVIGLSGDPFLVGSDYLPIALIGIGVLFLLWACSGSPHGLRIAASSTRSHPRQRRCPTGEETPSAIDERHSAATGADGAAGSRQATIAGGPGLSPPGPHSASTLACAWLVPTPGIAATDQIATNERRHRRVLTSRRRCPMAATLVRRWLVAGQRSAIVAYSRRRSGTRRRPEAS